MVIIIYLYTLFAPDYIFQQIAVENLGSLDSLYVKIFI